MRSKTRLAGVGSVIFALAASAGEPYPVRGRVVETAPEAREMTVALAEVPDGAPWKAGDTATFRIGEGAAAIGYAQGRAVRGKAVRENEAWLLRSIFPIDLPGRKAMRDQNAILRRETASMARPEPLARGDRVPGFALIDQRGEIVHARQLRGRPFVMNFIFTRCPMPKMCPAATRRMAKLQEMARAAGLDDLRFVSLSFDPAYDSPGVLREYAESYGVAGDTFHFLTGPEQVVDDLLKRFGVIAREEDGTINHTMSTLLVDATGRIVYRKNGSRWDPETFLRRAKAL